MSLSVGLLGKTQTREGEVELVNKKIYRAPAMTLLCVDSSDLDLLVQMRGLWKNSQSRSYNADIE
jgi:hypothetical protein